MASDQELTELRHTQDYDKHFIEVFDKSLKKHVFMIRPYTFQFLRAIEPFFELIAFSNLDMSVLKNLLKKMELILNKPLSEYVYSLS